MLSLKYVVNLYFKLAHKKTYFSISIVKNVIKWIEMFKFFKARSIRENFINTSRTCRFTKDFQHQENSSRWRSVCEKILSVKNLPRLAQHKRLSGLWLNGRDRLQTLFVEDVVNCNSYHSVTRRITLHLNNKSNGKALMQRRTDDSRICGL